MAKLDEIGYQVCLSSCRDVYETIQNPEFRNPALGAFEKSALFTFSPISTFDPPNKVVFAWF